MIMEHHVYFWLKEEYQTNEHRAQFETALKTLVSIEGPLSAKYGKPAAVAERPVIDNSWDYALAMTFESVEAHDLYQVAPGHEAFIKENKHLWSQVRVSDMELL